MGEIRRVGKPHSKKLSRGTLSGAAAFALIIGYVLVNVQGTREDTK